MSYGHLLGHLTCGIICGIAPLWNHEGMEIVVEGLDIIWGDPSTRPYILFYDNACKLRRYRINHPDLLWAMTRMVVDR